VEDEVAGPDPMALSWVALVLGHNDLRVLRGMREGGSPWLLRAGDRELVLRVGSPGDLAQIVTEVRALQLAAQAAIPAPRLLNYDDGSAAGVPLVLTGCLAGSSQIPPDPDPARLAALGGVAARLHTVPLEPSAELPLRTRPIAGEDFDRMRREQEPNELLEQAEAVVHSTRPASGHSVFVHGDLWQGNTLWDGGRLTGLVDWDCAGAGDPGVDLGSLRCDAAVCYGPEMAAHVLTGWEQAAGQPARDVAYWDVVGALATPPDMGWFTDSIRAQGHHDLDQVTALARRDLFLRQALDRLR
jgi:aminoglycoside phosphotransferase (APT) family kinase protein